MFELFQKAIPAPDHERHTLVRKLILHRLQSEPLAGIQTPTASDVEKNLPAEILKQTSEFTILYITEQYYGIRDTSADDEVAIKDLNELYTNYFAGCGLKLPAMEPPFTLHHYIRHYLDAGFHHGEPFSDAFIGDAIQIIGTFYGR